MARAVNRRRSDRRFSGWRVLFYRGGRGNRAGESASGSVVQLWPRWRLTVGGLDP
jgi:hypothetical protein